MDIEIRRAQRRDAQRRYRERHPERARAATAAWRAEHVEYVSARYRKWRTENPEKARAATARWRTENVDRVRANRTEWENRNKDRVTSARRRRYAIHSPEFRAKANLARTERKTKLVAMLGGKCMDCGAIPHLAAFEFDHVGPKSAAVSTLLGRPSLWTRAIAELKHCELVCANCHRVRTASRSGRV